MGKLLGKGKRRGVGGGKESDEGRKLEVSIRAWIGEGYEIR